jgi:NSS family neurotransmitter:Na+ symporter
VGAAFFLLLVISALASAISLLELVVAWATERFKVSRSTAAYVSALICWVVGIGTVLSFNLWSGWHPLGAVTGFETKTLFDLIDYLTSNIMLPLGGLFMGLFAAWVMTRSTFVEELRTKDGIGIAVLKIALGVVCPIIIFILFVVNISTSVGGG